MFLVNINLKRNFSIDLYVFVSILFLNHISVVLALAFTTIATTRATQQQQQLTGRCC